MKPRMARGAVPLALLFCCALLLLLPARLLLAAPADAPTAKGDVSTVGHAPQHLSAAELQKLEQARLAAARPSFGNLIVAHPQAPKQGVTSFVSPAAPPTPGPELLKVQAAKLEALRAGRLGPARTGGVKQASPSVPGVPATSPLPVVSVPPRKEAPR